MSCDPVPTVPDDTPVVPTFDEEDYCDDCEEWYLTVAVERSECSGAPECLTVESAAIRGIMFIGTELTLPGQTISFGPVSLGNNKVLDLDFRAYHQKLNKAAFPGLVTFDPNVGLYRIGLEDGFGDGDYNDIELFVEISRTPPPGLVALRQFAANDSFASRQLIAGASGSVNGHNYCTGRETDEPTLGGLVGAPRMDNSVWYEWVAPSTGDFDFELSGADPFLQDTIIGIHTGDTLASLVLVGQDDDGGVGSFSKLTISAIEGQSYKIQVGAYQGEDEGDFTLTWNPTPVGGAPANDNFANREVLATPSGGPLAATLVDATVETGEPLNFNDQSIWYEWVAPGNGILAINTNFTFPPLSYIYIGIYTGSQVNGLLEIDNSYDSISTPVVAGTSYKIQLAVLEMDGTGPFTFSWTFT